jgi:hypothetical protein
MLAIAGWADVISAVLRNTILQTSIPDRFRSRMSSIQMAVVQGGPRLGDMESGGVATATSIEFSVVSGGLACIVGAVVIGLLMPHFRTTTPVRSTRSVGPVRCYPYSPAMPFAEATWGEVDPAAFGRIVVVSPHFDDAAMGAGHLWPATPTPR